MTLGHTCVAKSAQPDDGLRLGPGPPSLAGFDQGGVGNEAYGADAVLRQRARPSHGNSFQRGTTRKGRRRMGGERRDCQGKKRIEESLVAIYSNPAQLYGLRNACRTKTDDIAMRIYKQSQRRPSIPLPFRPLVSPVPKRMVDDVPDIESLLPHSPLPSFSIADPQALFAQGRTMESPTPSKTKPKVLNKMGTLGKRVLQEVLGGTGNNPRLRGEPVPSYGRGGAARPKLRPTSGIQPYAAKRLGTLGALREAIFVKVDTSVTRRNDLSVVPTLSPNPNVVASASDPTLPHAQAMEECDEPDLPSPTGCTVATSHRGRSQSHGRTDFLSMMTRSRSPSRSSPPPVPPLPPRSQSHPPPSPHNWVPISEPSSSSREGRKSRPSPLKLTVHLYQPRPRMYDAVGTFVDAPSIGRNTTPSRSVALPPTPSSSSYEGRSQEDNIASQTDTPKIDVPRGRTRGRGRRPSSRSPETRSVSTEAHDGSDETRKARLLHQSERLLEQDPNLRQSRPLPSPPAPFPRISPLSSTPAGVVHSHGSRYGFSDYGGSPRNSIASSSSSWGVDSLLAYHPSPYAPHPSALLPTSPSALPIPIPNANPATLPLPLSPLNPSYQSTNPFPAVPSTPQMQIHQALELFVALANANLRLAAPLVAQPPASSTPETSLPPPEGRKPNPSVPPPVRARSNRNSVRTSLTSSAIGSVSPADSNSSSDRSRSLRNSLAPSQQTPTPPGSPRTLPRGMRVSTPSSGARSGGSIQLSLYPETTTGSSVISSPIEEDPDIIPPIPPLPPSTFSSVTEEDLSSRNIIDTRPSTALSDRFDEEDEGAGERPHSWIAEVRGWEELGKGAGLGIVVDTFGSGPSQSTETLSSTTETTVDSDYRRLRPTTSAVVHKTEYRSELPSPMASPVRVSSISTRADQAPSPVPRGPRLPGSKALARTSAIASSRTRSSQGT